MGDDESGVAVEPIVGCRCVRFEYDVGGVVLGVMNEFRDLIFTRCPNSVGGVSRYKVLLGCVERSST